MAESPGNSNRKSSSSRSRKRLSDLVPPPLPAKSTRPPASNSKPRAVVPTPPQLTFLAFDSEPDAESTSSGTSTVDGGNRSATNPDRRQASETNGAGVSPQTASTKIANKTAKTSTMRVDTADIVRERPAPIVAESNAGSRLFGAKPPSSQTVRSRLEYQRALADLLYRPNGAWRNRGELQQTIGQRILNASKAMDSQNFQRLSRQDLERMAEAYDEMFFGGLCLPLARSYGLSFRLSSRMTRAGGKTTRRIYRATRSMAASTHYEIALSTSLLFQSFRSEKEQVRVCGQVCEDRLTAMQRIVEHEMIHLCEMLAWVHSDCSANRFQSIARNMFGHTEHRHELVTQQERAFKDYNIRAGTRVVFRIEGRELIGIVNRITRRATILVEDARGERYSDGKRYLKYYVPIQQLRPIA